MPFLSSEFADTISAAYGLTFAIIGALVFFSIRANRAAKRK